MSTLLEMGQIIYNCLIIIFLGGVQLPYLNASIYNRTNSSLTAMPSNIPADTDAIVLSDNQIARVDSIPGLLPKLVNFTMSRNILSEFPDFTNCTNVTTVTLWRNQLTTIPANKLDILTNLVRLDIRHNRLHAFPDVPGPGNTLTQLLLSYNNLTEMPRTQKVGRNLQTLFVSGNKIRDIPRALLEHLQNLTYFVIGGNPLRRFPDIEPIMAKLHTVEVDQSPEVGLPAGLFPQLPDIHTVSLNNIGATVIPFDICLRGDLPMDFNVHLKGNPFQCDQGMTWLKLAEEAGVTVSVDTSCYHPDPWIVKAWTTVDWQDLTYPGTLHKKVKDIICI